MAEGLLEIVVQHGSAYVEEGLHCRPVPTHLLLLVHALGNDLVGETVKSDPGVLLSTEARSGQDGPFCALATWYNRLVCLMGAV
jgi:hypothetical protein